MKLFANSWKRTMPLPRRAAINFDGAGKVVYENPFYWGLILNDLIKMDCIILVAGAKRRQKACLQSAIASLTAFFVTDEGAALEMLRLAGK